MNTRLFKRLEYKGHFSLSVTLTAIRVTVNEVSSHLCKILTLIIVKKYLQTGRRRYRIARLPVVKADSHVSGNQIQQKRTWAISSIDDNFYDCFH